MNPSRYSVLLTAAAIAVILLALAVRISQFTPHLSPLQSAAYAPSGQPLSPAQSFFQGNGQGNQSAAGNPAGATPAAPAAAVAPPSDTISAAAYLVGNVETGQIYFEQDPKGVFPLASMSKLFTAITATDTILPDTEIEVTEPETEVPADASNLKAGEQFTLSELLYPMLLDSSNVAAEAVASSSDRTAFIESMNAFAWKIGDTTAYFADPTGLDDHNQASADDMFTLAKYLYQSRPDILAITRTAHLFLATTTDHEAHEFDSIHPFVNDPRFVGGKTGFTYAAEDTMLTILNIGGQPIGFIVLRSEQREQDTDLLISKYEESVS